MKYFDVVLYATIREVVSVGARDEDEAVEIALQIARAGYTPHGELDFEVEEVNLGDALDVAE
jgi:hypothetical protein